MEKFLVEYKSAVEKKLAEYKCNTNTAIELKLGMCAIFKCYCVCTLCVCVCVYIYSLFKFEVEFYISVVYVNIVSAFIEHIQILFILDLCHGVGRCLRGGRVYIQEVQCGKK